MKKAAAILLALILALSLFACSSSSQKAGPSASASATPSSNSSTSPSDGTSTSPSSSGSTGVGYFTDKVDSKARKTYSIGYFYLSALALEKAHFSAMQSMQSVLNFTCKDYSANNDDDTFIQNMETASQSNYDGYIIEPDAQIFPRIVEVANELKVPYVFTVNAYRDESGSNQVPAIILDQYKDGVTQTDWFADHYSDYWKGVNKSDIALMSLEYSTNPDLVSRSEGVKDEFAKLFPGNPVYIGDMVGQNIDASIASDQCSAILTAHPEVKYWFINGSVENFGQGAGAATATLGKTDNTLIVTSGANILPTMWDTNTAPSNWVASYAVYNYNYVVPALTGVIALIDGRATPETLWQDQKKPSDKCTALIAGDQMVTIDNYKSVQADIAKTYGVTGA